MSQILDLLKSVPEPAVLALIGALVFGEAAVFLGFVFPGETAVLLGGFLASTGRLSLTALAVVVVVTAILGDACGYWVGKRFGQPLLESRFLSKQRPRVERAREFLDGRGGSAVFLGRFTAFLRAVTPGLAGLSGMRFHTFLLWNAAGGITWGLLCVFGGYLAGNSYETVASYIGKGGAIAAAVVVVVGLVVWRVRKKRAEGDDGDSGGSGENGGGQRAATAA